MKESKKYRRASKNLHATIERLVKHYRPKTVLDLGSGKGGVPLRLKRAGFDVTATDLHPSMNNAEGIKVLQIDLNKPLTIKKKFDMVVCSEVIEHLYDPHKLFLDAHQLLNENGLFLFTTPNNENWFSRLYFLFTGKFSMFPGITYDERGFEGHITPIFVWQTKMLIRKHFTIEKITFNRSVMPVLRFNLPFKGLFWGQNLMMVLRRK